MASTPRRQIRQKPIFKKAFRPDKPVLDPLNTIKKTPGKPVIFPSLEQRKGPKILRLE